MAEGFGENVAPTAAIRAILGSYPFSIGLLREILQNSDDARATKQVFIFDRRYHGTETIYHPYLAATQGPALLAYNDGLIQERDWEAPQNIHRSSKKIDTSKIGKYGIGLRSCYHVTDNPHILSGSHLAILDARHDFAEFLGVKTGGVKINIEDAWQNYRDHLSAFKSILPLSQQGKRFDGTVFRLPLRTSGSDISSRMITPDEISELLQNPALEELSISLLFLRNVSSVRIYEVGDDGRKVCIATSTIHRTPGESYGHYKTQKVTVETHCPGNGLEEQEWRIPHAPFSESEAIEALSRRLGCNPSTTLSQHKLIPTIDLAIPIGAEDSTKIGRLFTFLPLPLRTGFPVHINALFSLTQSRQNLRNGGEVGIVKNSDDHALIEWNRMLFDTYIPQAWAHLLEVLVKEDQVGNIFDAWPHLQGDIDSGDYVYWKDMPQQVMKYALDLRVWPISGTSPCMHESAGNLIFALKSTSDQDLAALIRAGLLIVRAPEYLTDIIGRHYMTQVAVLSPQIVYSRLLNIHDKLLGLNDSDARVVLSYLLSTKVCDYIVGLPLVPLVRQSRTSLKKRSGATLLPLFDEVLEDLFSCFDSNAVSLRRLPADVRDILVKQGCHDLNLTHVQDSQVIAYLKASPYTSDICRATSADEMDWLNKFWGWLGNKKDKTVLYGQLSPFYLVPVTRGLQTVIEPVFDATGDDSLAEVLEVLAIPLIDRRLSTTAHAALKELKPCSTFYALLRTLPPSTDARLTEGQAQYLSSYLIRALSFVCDVRGSLLNGVPLRSRLRALPIYPIITLSAAGVPSTSRMPIDEASAVRGVDLSEISILPQVNSLVYLDLRSIDREILEHLDQDHRNPLSINEMHNMMFQHLMTQTIETQVAFVRYIDIQFSSIPRDVLDRLGQERFVPARDGSLRAPKLLIDPSAELARLYPGASSSLPDLSRPLIEELISHLRNLKLLVTQLSIGIVRERARFISENHCAETKVLACVLLDLINSSRLDCHNLFDSPNFPRSLEWIPTLEGLKSPLWCRHLSSHLGRTCLFDKVMPLVVPGTPISFSLSSVFKWSGEVTFEVLSQQLVTVLDGGDKSYDRVQEIVKELGNRDLTETQLFSLLQVLQGREWVPTRDGSLASTACALLGEEDIPAIGFHSVVLSKYIYPKVISFLEQMGCYAKPSKEVMLKRLQVLHESGSGRAQDSAIIRGVIRLLTWLPPLTSDDQTRLFIPDSAGVLRKSNRVYYNDLGERVHLVDIGDHTVVHPEVHDELARKLGLRRLGLLTPEGQDPDFDLDMGEDLMTTIRNRLREYTSSQLLLEFIANASDAGATEFGVLADTEEGPTERLLSPRCIPLQRAPALVIYNNSIFTNDDFRGILRIGVGGKEKRQDTIGQFGLGALTMFHVTEFVTIVSGDQVLFLNPSKAHLPVPQASLKLPLARVRKLYRDHLSQLSGLFHFKLPEDDNEHYFYNGTIFRLPLRSGSHLPDAETIFREEASIADIVSGFEVIAPKCLLFTNIYHIKFLGRIDHRPKLLWSVTATRKDSSQTKGVDAHTVSISAFPKLFETQDWRIISLLIRGKLPSFIDILRKKYRLRIPPVARIAACQSPKPSSNHDLFSTLPLPISLDLPVHISASFILASDRRSIRLDEYENVEASYNRWLLTTIVPQLYLRLLEDRAVASHNEVSDSGVYWPGNSSNGVLEQPNTISTMIINALYQIAAVSEAPILRSQFYDHVLSLPTAHLSYNLPHSVVEVLEVIKPHDLVKLPPQITHRLVNIKNNRASTVTPKYVQTQLLDNGSNFDPSTFKVEELQELIGHQTQQGFHTLLGLRLLPLENGTITHFESSSKSRFYVAPPTVLEASIFSPDRLIHRQLNTMKLLNFDRLLNVTRITAANIGELLKDHLSATPNLKDTSLATQQWIERFWRVFPLLHLPPSAVATYPLIPTLQTGIYVSISHCTARSAILADFTRHKWLSRCFAQMGFTPVDTAQLQHEILPHTELSCLDVESVLITLFDHPSRSIEDLFGALDKESHLHLVSWITDHFSLQRKKYFDGRLHYKSLPLWETVQNTYVSANQVRMLPSYISLKIAAPFASGTISNYSTILLHMGVKPISSIRSILNIPQTLKPDMDRKYERLIQALLSTNGPSLPTPNSERMIVESNFLYSSQGALFQAAFGSSSNHFILPSFRHFENQLSKFGLKRQQDLDMSMFKECVVSFQCVADTTDRAARATIIFRIYSEDLPLRVPANQGSQWRDLDKLRFIPRKKKPEPLGQDIEALRYIAFRVRFLPDVVSPDELVRAEFSAIAWTQLAIYHVEPPQRVVMSHPELSMPTITNVVNHLVILVTEVTRDHPRNALVLSQIKQTYIWLDTHAEEAKPLLLQCTKAKVPLFLNVDDPAVEDWEWMLGDHILLETYDTGFYRCPREFLRPFHNLLIAAGAITINYPDEHVSKENPTEDLLTTTRTSFNEMRKEGICTDVSFTFEGDIPLKAHRSFLASISSHFKLSFSGSFTEAGDASSSNPIKICMSGFSRRCVGLILDFVYTEIEPRLERNDTDIVLALEMLDLTHLWSMHHVHLAVQNVMIKLKMVDPFNLDEVRKVAEKTHASTLLGYCDACEVRNERFVQYAREGRLECGMSTN